MDSREHARTRAQMLALMNKHELERAVAAGWVHRVARGSYQLGVPEIRLRMLLIVARAPEAVFSHLVAAWAWGLRASHPDDLDVLVARSRRGVVGARAHRRVSLPHVELSGFRFTTLTATLSDLIELWGVATVAHVVDRRFTTQEQRERLAEEAMGLPARQRNKLLPVLEWVPGRARSNIEARIARELQLRGYDIALNMRIGQYTWDIVHAGARLVIEYDSWKFHSDEIAFRDDRARQNALVRRGYRILRYSDADVQLRFDQMIDEICGTIDGLLAGPMRLGEWDERWCGDLYVLRRQVWEMNNSRW